MPSLSVEDDLPCLSPIKDSAIIRAVPLNSDHVGITFAQLVNDKKTETERNEIYKELEEFKLDDFTEAADCEDDGDESVPAVRALIQYLGRY